MTRLRNPDHIQQAKQTWSEIIEGRDVTTFTGLETVVIYQTYNQLYPASSAQPSLEDAINQIKLAIEVYDVKYKR